MEAILSQPQYVKPFISSLEQFQYEDANIGIPILYIMQSHNHSIYMKGMLILQKMVYILKQFQTPDC